VYEKNNFLGRKETQRNPIMKPSLPPPSPKGKKPGRCRGKTPPPPGKIEGLPRNSSKAAPEVRKQGKKFPPPTLGGRTVPGKTRRVGRSFAWIFSKRRYEELEKADKF